MAVRRFKATKDNTITNAYKANLTTRGTGSNMGASDILEVFSIYGQASTSSSELSRILIDFDIDAINSARVAKNIPASGSVDFYLRMFNAEHSSTTPTNFTLTVAAISQSWDEGNGLDMEDYSDPGIGSGGKGSTWLTRKSGSFSQCSLELNGSDEYVTVADSDDFTFADSGVDKPFSISAWIKVDSLADDRPIVVKWDGSGTNLEWYFYVRGNSSPSGALSLLVYDKANSATISSRTDGSIISTGEWYHVMVTYDGRGGATAADGIKFYVDGASKTATASNNASYVSMVNTTTPVRIGAEPNLSDYFDGKLDEISVWDKELDSAQVTELYNEGVPNNLIKTTTYTEDTTSKLVAWWRIEIDSVLTPDTTSTIQDRSANSHNGTGTGLETSNFSTTDFAGNGVANAVNTAQYWLDEGGTFSTGSQTTVYSQVFSTGLEDLEIDVSQQVEEWINGNTASYGFGVYLQPSLENEKTSYYTKKFFARDSQYFLKRPVIEARWNDSRFDDSSNFYLSSSRVPAADNLNTLYLYNYVRGQLQDIPGLGAENKIYLSIYTGSNSVPSGDKITLPVGGGVVANNDYNVTGSKVATGIYSASFAYTSSGITEIYPVWHSSSVDPPVPTIEYLTASSITVNTFDTQTPYPINSYKANITNLQSQYGSSDVVNFRVFVQNKNFLATVYTVASTAVQPTIMEKMYYKVSRVVDEEIVINYGTGSGDAGYTQLSYDSAGNYFDLDMSIFEPDFSYQISFMINDAGKYTELKDKFKFRIIDENDLPG